MKSNKALYWVIGVVALAMIVFVYIMVGEAPRTLPKITLSYFSDEADIAAAVGKRLYQEIGSHHNYWIGIEPDKADHIKVANEIKAQLEKSKKFAHVILDTELNLGKEANALLQVSEEIPIKEDIYKFGEKLQNFEKANEPYLVISASVYSSSLLKKNPVDLIKEKYLLKPMTFSIGYLPVSPADEKSMQFACNTEDRNGTSDWGCVVVNKSRGVRRKVNLNNVKPWIGLMDLTGEQDYMLLIKKK